MHRCVEMRTRRQCACVKNDGRVPPLLHLTWRVKPRSMIQHRSVRHYLKYQNFIFLVTAPFVTLNSRSDIALLNHLGSRCEHSHRNGSSSALNKTLLIKPATSQTSHTCIAAKSTMTVSIIPPHAQEAGLDQQQTALHQAPSEAQVCRDLSGSTLAEGTVVGLLFTPPDTSLAYAEYSSCMGTSCPNLAQG